METMTVELRPWTTDDAPALVTAVAGSPELVVQLGGAGPATVGQARDIILAQLPFNDSRRNWAITVHNAVVGNVGLSAIERRHGTAWAYYWLAGPARGHGYAARALATMAGWAFDDGLFRLELGHRANNPASCRVAARAGFLAEGIERGKLLYGSERYDVETHARLRTDPEPDIKPISLAS